MKKLLLLLTCLCIMHSVCYAYEDILNVEVGESFTLNGGSYRYIQGVLWDYDTSVFETVSVSGYSTRGKFKAISPSPSSGSIIQATIYYKKSGTTSSGVNKDVVAWKVYVADDGSESTVSLPASMNMDVNEVKEVCATTSSSKYSGDFRWESSNHYIVEVIRENGNTAQLRANSPGSTYIHVTLDNGNSDNIYVKVNEVEYPTVTASPASGSYEKGTKIYLYASQSGATIRYTTDGSTPTTSSQKYSSYITLNKSFTLKARAYNSSGNGGEVLTCKYTVTVNEPESITISPNELTFGINESQYLNCTILPSGASQDVTWESDDPTVATVSSSGKVTGKKVGTTTITAKTSNGLTSTCKVTVAQLCLIDGIRYEMDDKYGNLTVLPLSSGKYKGDIVIPQKVSINGKSYDVEYIGENAFKDCTELNSIIILPRLRIIEDYAFYGCTKLTSIRLNMVAVIHKSAFEGCTGLKAIQLLLDDPLIIYGMIGCKDAFKDCNNLKKVYIDNLNMWVNYVSIRDNALGNPLWPAQAELYLNGEKVVNLTVPAPKSKKLGFALFGQCSSIESVTMADGIEIIDGRVFQNCDNLKLINLPASLREIHGYAFAWCDNIETVNCYATTPPNMQTGWDDLNFNEYFAFYASSPQKITLHVPKGCKQAYANAPGWNLFSTIIDDLDSNAGVNEIVADSPDNSIKNVYNLQGVLIKKNATKEEIESLPKGIYIIGGKKVLVR